MRGHSSPAVVLQIHIDQLHGEASCSGQVINLTKLDQGLKEEFTRMGITMYQVKMKISEHRT